MKKMEMNNPIALHPFAAKHIGKTHKANAKTKFCQRAFQPFPLRSRHKTKIVVKLKISNTKQDKSQCLTRGTVNKGFSGFRGAVIRSKISCNLTGKKPAIPY